jgi:hypothetical protein
MEIDVVVTDPFLFLARVNEEEDAVSKGLHCTNRIFYNPL